MKATVWATHLTALAQLGLALASLILIGDRLWSDYGFYYSSSTCLLTASG